MSDSSEREANRLLETDTKRQWFVDRNKQNTKSQYRGSKTKVTEATKKQLDVIFGAPKCSVCGTEVLFSRRDKSCDSCRSDI